ncbi:hypothetical protein [Aneurinibacillus uraniidurans]|uniref:hypothetical protein n=1 Tax=Aneurinibacillus uraniidurans TaxID=2966586 RepID=UPI00234965EB|nr:hypothetical protein [Aneurinibacillus sp. B1]WCN38546.1 hypothetical protein PO771_03865 [Aneurinibacillus sp. B1]
MNLAGLTGYYLLYAFLTILLSILSRHKLKEIKRGYIAFGIAVCLGAAAPFLTAWFGLLMVVVLLAVVSVVLVLTFSFVEAEEAVWVHVPLPIEDDRDAVKQEDEVEVEVEVEAEEEHKAAELLQFANEPVSMEQEMHDLLNHTAFSAATDEDHSMIELQFIEELPMKEEEPLIKEKEEVQEESSLLEDEVLEAEPHLAFEFEDDSPAPVFEREADEKEKDYFVHLGDVLQEEGVSFERLKSKADDDPTEEGGWHRA